VRVFLGITGASGAPYAKGILDGLAAAGAEVGLCASSAGIEVLATELYRDATLPRDEVLGRFVADAAVTVYDAQDWKSPYASGSAKVDAYVVVPVLDGHGRNARLGAMQNLSPPRRVGRAEGAPEARPRPRARRRSRRSTSAASRPSTTRAP
jgi:4-hydroxy-3-polyprenylbenzoate decarboxylase